MTILTPSIAAQRTNRQLLHSMEPEPFVTAVEVEAFLRCAPVTVKRVAREGETPAHSIQNGIRRSYGLLLIRHRSEEIVRGGTNRSFYSWPQNGACP